MELVVYFRTGPELDTPFKDFFFGVYAPIPPLPLDRNGKFKQSPRQVSL